MDENLSGRKSVRSRAHTAEVPEVPAAHQQCGTTVSEIKFLLSEVCTLLSGLDPNSAETKWAASKAAEFLR